MNLNESEFGFLMASGCARVYDPTHGRPFGFGNAGLLNELDLFSMVPDTLAPTIRRHQARQRACLECHAGSEKGQEEERVGDKRTG